MDTKNALQEWHRLGIAQVRWMELRWREGQGGSATIYHAFTPDECSHQTTYPLTQARMARLNAALRNIHTAYGHTILLAGGGIETQVDAQKRLPPI